MLGFGKGLECCKYDANAREGLSMLGRGRQQQTAAAVAAAKEKSRRAGGGEGGGVVWLEWNDRLLQGYEPGVVIVRTGKEKRVSYLGSYEYSGGRLR